jgi:hypothetical protein
MPSEEVLVMDQVIIGAGPHKLSVTIEARDTRGDLAGDRPVRD